MLSSMVPDSRGLDTYLYVVVLTAFNVTVTLETALFWDMTY